MSCSSESSTASPIDHNTMHTQLVADHASPLRAVSVNRLLWVLFERCAARTGLTEPGALCERVRLQSMQYMLR